MDDFIYLDNNATTKIDPRVLEAMMPFLTDQYGNASSGHSFGLLANQQIKASREKIANLVSCKANEIVFTSGATEGINLCLKGLVEAHRHGGRNHIITVETEHYAVLDTCRYMESIGCEVSYVPVLPNGLIDLNVLEEEIKSHTLLVCVMAVNNETGVIQPIGKIGQLAHRKGAFFMTDASQAVGKIQVSMDELEIDLLCFSAHKFYGPKGIGALCIRDRHSNKLKVNPLIHGGGHEKGLRSGTLNVPAIVGFGEAAELSSRDMASDAKRIRILRDYLENKLLKLDSVSVNGDLKKRVYNVTNLCIKGVTGETIINKLRTVAVSNGSACTSELVESSHVLRAMGLSDDDSFSSIRFSLGRFNMKSEIDIVLKRLIDLLAAERELKSNVENN